MSLTVEQYRDKEAFEKSAILASDRRKPGEERFWEVQSYDPESPYHSLNTVYTEPSYSFQPNQLKGLAAYALSGYRSDSDLIRRSLLRVDQIVDEIRETHGQQLRDLYESNQNLVVTSAHQSRFETLEDSLFVQLAMVDDEEDQILTRANCSVIITRYIGCYGVKMAEITGDPNMPTQNAFEVASNFARLIPVFPRTKVREVSGIDPSLQLSVNRRMLTETVPEEDKPHFRFIAACAESEIPLPMGGYKISTVSPSVKKLFKRGWHSMAMAGYVHPTDPDRTFFKPSEILPPEEYSVEHTMDDHTLWIAKKRQQLTGYPVLYY